MGDAEKHEIKYIHTSSQFDSIWSPERPPGVSSFFAAAGAGAAAGAAAEAASLYK